MKRVLATIVLSMCVSACGGSSPSPTTVTPPPTPAPSTAVIGLSGNLVFGSLTIGQNASAILTITNSGNATLTISGMTVPSGSGGVFVSSFTSGTISPGVSQSATIRFSPTAAITYSGVLTVNGDQASGTNTITISGTGLAVPPPSTYTLKGIVNDGTTGPSGRIPGTTVRVVDGANTGKSALTDATGNYLITQLTSGSFTLTASANDYQSATKPVSLSGDTTVDFSLQRIAAPPVPRQRIGAICNDGTSSTATGSGACSSHGGVRCWRYNDGTCTNP